MTVLLKKLRLLNLIYNWYTACPCRYFKWQQGSSVTVLHYFYVFVVYEWTKYIPCPEKCKRAYGWHLFMIK